MCIFSLNFCNYQLFIIGYKRGKKKMILKHKDDENVFFFLRIIPHRITHRRHEETDCDSKVTERFTACTAKECKNTTQILNHIYEY